MDVNLTPFPLRPPLSYASTHTEILQVVLGIVRGWHGEKYDECWKRWYWIREKYVYCATAQAYPESQAFVRSMIDGHWAILHLAGKLVDKSSGLTNVDAGFPIILDAYLREKYKHLLEPADAD